MAAPAQAIAPAAGPTVGLTAAQFNEAIKELKESPLKRSVVTTAVDTRTTFDLPEGFTMTVVEPKKASGGIQPRIGGGTDGGGVYVLFNQWQQDMLYMGGELFTECKAHFTFHSCKETAVSLRGPARCASR